MQDAGWQVTRQPFDFDFFFEDAPTTFEQVSPDPATYTEDVDYATTEFSGSGNVTAAPGRRRPHVPADARAELEQRL